MIPPRHTFPKAEKLKSRKQIDLLFQGGKSFFAAPVKCYFRVDELTGLPVDQLIRVKSETSNVNSETSNVNSETSNVKGETSNVNGETRKLKQPEDVEREIESTPENPTSNIRRPELFEGKHQTSNLLAGVSVSKRNFKHSVDRNRIKRLLREAYRLHKHTLQEKLQSQNKSLEVFFVFTDKTLPNFAVVEDKMKYCIRRLGKIVEGGV